MSTFREKIQEYAQRLKAREDFFTGDVKQLEYFAEHASNNTEEAVRQKVSVLNHYQIHDLACHEEIIDHILSLNIDEHLRVGDLQVVNNIAHFYYRGKDRVLLEFASEYCNSHKPTVYPIFSEQHIGLMADYLANHDHLKEGETLSEYTTFKEGLDYIMDRFGLTEMLNYYEVHKLDWLYVDKLLKELGSENAWLFPFFKELNERL